jgi:hypothetical protein
MAKRDFIFIDESGEPGQEIKYYILGLLHITDVSLKNINTHLGAFRYFGCIKRELISTRLNKLQKEQLLNILKISINNNDFIKASAIYVNKDNYQGPYLKSDFNPNYFRNLMIRKLLEFHFSENKPQSKEIELIIDRFYSLEEQEQKMRNYLRTDKYNLLPNFLHIIQADSRYVELLQIADWISGSVKEKFFTHPERNYGDLFDYIMVKQILR